MKMSQAQAGANHPQTCLVASTMQQERPILFMEKPIIVFTSLHYYCNTNANNSILNCLYLGLSIDFKCKTFIIM
jgi:hypothetical protein